MTDPTVDDPPDGWTVWSADNDGRVILAYRPDVFDSTAFPPECLPTLYLTRGRRNSRRPGPERDTAADWFVTLFLEPVVNYPEQRFEDRADAIAELHRLAEQFADGEIDYRALYQVPRESYFEKLDELTGRKS